MNRALIGLESLQQADDWLDRSIGVHPELQELADVRRLVGLTDCIADPEQLYGGVSSGETMRSDTMLPPAALLLQIVSDDVRIALDGDGYLYGDDLLRTMRGEATSCVVEGVMVNYGGIEDKVPLVGAAQGNTILARSLYVLDGLGVVARARTLDVTTAPDVDEDKVRIATGKEMIARARQVAALMDGLEDELQVTSQWFQDSVHMIAQHVETGQRSATLPELPDGHPVDILIRTESPAAYLLKLAIGTQAVDALCIDRGYDDDDRARVVSRFFTEGA